MKIFITGSSGFIGTRLVKYILKNFKNTDVCTFDLTEGDDIRNEFQLSKAMELFRPDVVVHLAALAGVRRGEEYPEEYYSTNILGTENVFKCAKKHGVGKVISFSSSSVFGIDGYPCSVYGISKHAAEHIAKKYSKQNMENLDTLHSIFVVRPFTVYGENGRNDQVIRKWIGQILKGDNISFYGNGDSFRPYTYVEDLVQSVCKMINTNEKGYLDFHVYGITKVSLTELLNTFERLCKNWGIRFGIERLPKHDVDPMGNDPELYETNGNPLIDCRSTTDFYAKVKSILKAELYKPWKQNH